MDEETPKEPSNAVEACLANDNISGLRDLLRSYPPLNLNHRNHRGRPLHVAVSHDNHTAVEMLLEAGAAPLVLDDILPLIYDDVYTPITLAAFHGYREIVRTLWHHSPPEAHYEHHRPFQTCLVTAAYKGHVAIVSDLLNWCNTWPRDVMEHALSCAATHWELYVVEELLSKYSFTQDTLNWTLRRAADQKQMLTNFDPVEHDGVDFLNQQLLIELLINSGADPNAHNKDGQPILFSTIYWREMVGGTKVLLENGADPNATDKEGNTALHFLAHTRKDHRNSSKLDGIFDETEIRLLLKHGGSVCQQNKLGDAPIHLAAMHTPLRIFRQFLSSHPGGETAGSVGSMNRHGETLLHFAAAGGKLETVKYLLAHEGTNINAINLNGWSPLVCALHRPTGNPDSLGHSRNLGTAVRIARLLLAHGADPLVTTSEGLTPLHVLASHYDDGESSEGEELAMELIKRGADIEARATLIPSEDRKVVLLSERAAVQLRDLWGFRLHQRLEASKTTGGLKPELPLLHWAIRHGAVGVLKALLASGVRLPSPDSMTGQGPVDAASERLEPGLQRVVRRTIVELLKAAQDQEWDSDETMA